MGIPINYTRTGVCATTFLAYTEVILCLSQHYSLLCFCALYLPSDVDMLGEGGVIAGIMDRSELFM